MPRDIWAVRPVLGRNCDAFGSPYGADTTYYSNACPWADTDYYDGATVNHVS
jgi:hypothetical protein